MNHGEEEGVTKDGDIIIIERIEYNKYLLKY
jgi:hypothetical protein